MKHVTKPSGCSMADDTDHLEMARQDVFAAACALQEGQTSSEEALLELCDLLQDALEHINSELIRRAQA